MYLKERSQYNTEVLTRDEYRRFGEYLQSNNLNIGHVVEKLDDTFKITLDSTPLTFWEEILQSIRTLD
jgi:hypothetical protein|tara:strand:- start:215 stop:418 length:204 start_codon:yes stop_codon:yes gene_type:complete